MFGEIWFNIMYSFFLKTCQCVKNVNVLLLQQIGHFGLVRMTSWWMAIGDGPWRIKSWSITTGLVVLLLATGTGSVVKRPHHILNGTISIATLQVYTMSSARSRLQNRHVSIGVGILSVDRNKTINIQNLCVLDFMPCISPSDSFHFYLVTYCIY